MVIRRRSTVAKVTAVRMYPSGGVICQRVEWSEVMTPRQAIKALEAGEPACVAMEYLWAMRCFCEPAKKRLVWVTADELRVLIKVREDAMGMA